MPAPDFVIDALIHAVGERAAGIAVSALQAPSPNLGDDEMRAAGLDVDILRALRGDIDDPEGYPPEVVAAIALRWALLF